MPVAVLEAIGKSQGIPQQYLLELGARSDIVTFLPLGLRRQVWAASAGAFETELARLLDNYASSSSVVAAVQEFGSPRSHCKPSERRKSEPALAALADAIGSDSTSSTTTLYRHVINAIEARWQQAAGTDHAQVAVWCALRTELLLLQAERGNHRLAHGDSMFELAQ